MTLPPSFDAHEARTHEHVMWRRTGWRRVNGRAQFAVRRCAGIVMGEFGNGDISVASYEGRILHKRREDVRTFVPQYMKGK